MKKIILYIVLGFISFLGHAVESTDFVKKSAEQIDFLYARNKDIEEGRVHEKKWFIYFLGSDQPTLQEYLLGIDTTKNKTFSSDYLDNLNNLLIEINKSEKVAMYVAVSDYNNPITVPLLPSGTSIQDKIQSLKEILKKPDGFTDLTGNQSSIDIDKGLKDYEKFQAFFSKKTEEIYNNSVLSKIESDTNKRVLMPLSVFHYITIDNQKRKFYTLTIRSSKGDKEADEVVKEMRPLISGLTGKTLSEKKIESYVRAYLDYYSGNTGVTINSGGIKTTIKKDSELYKRAYGQSGSETDKEWSTTTQLLDFSGMLTPSDKKQIFKEIDFSRTLFNNMKMYVVLTDTNTSANILQNLNTLQPKKDQYYIWVHLNEDGTLSLSNLVPQDFNKKIAWATAHWTEVMWANAELNLGEGTVAHLKANLAVSNQLLTYASKILAIGIVPEEYWNPKHKDYPSYMPYIASAFNASMGDFGSVLNAEKAQMQFAFKTGIWNGVIDEVKGLADAGKMATEYFLNPEKAREFDQGFSQLTFGTVWDSFKKAHGYEENQETNAFKLSHQLGKDIVFVASFFVGVGEVAALAKTGKLAKISTLANNMSKISRAVTGGVIKILKKMPPNLAKAIKKLPDNIIKEVQKVGAKSYLILKLNTTKLAKISDDAVFSEMKLLQDGTTVKLTDGNNAVFDNVNYIDDIGEKTGTIAIVKNGDEVGVKISDAGGDLIRGVSKSSFKKSFTAPDEIAEQAWRLFEKEDWKTLEKLFKDNNINVPWPPNDGFVDIVIKSLSKNKIIDRYGGYIDNVTGEFKDGGKFFAKDAEALTNRALPPGSENKIYSRYEIIKDIPDVKTGKAIPWFGEKGLGIQYQVERSVDKLIEAGYIRRISFVGKSKIEISGEIVSKLGNKINKVDDWLVKYANNLGDDTAKLLDDLEINLGTKNIDDVFEDAQGRLVVMAESSTSTRVVATIEQTASGKMKSFKYARAYNKAGQPGKPPISANGLTPDFAGNPSWLYPVTGNQKNIVKIKLSGKRKGTDGDFHRANIEAGFPTTKAPEGYTWHHMDDFDPKTGESTMQLVKRIDHEGSLPHTGSVKQMENYTGVKYID